jgi:DSF synthase
MDHKLGLPRIWGPYEQLDVQYDPDHRLLWYRLSPRGRPCFNLELLDELRRFQHRVEQVNLSHGRSAGALPIRYLVLASRTPGVFNLGGDLAHFAGLIRRRDREGLFRYAKACIDVLYPNAVSLEQPLTTVTLVQGDALGGGFEAAISSNVVIAEESAKFGLPEVLFNLIPGMGAYSFLIRRVSPDVAENIIMSGELMSAARMHELGLVDQVVPDGHGERAVINFIRRHQKRANAHAAMIRVRQTINPVTYEELITITRIWVDTALKLAARDLRMIERLVAAQNRRVGDDAEPGPQAMEGTG